MTIGIIGNGFVGSAINAGFALHCNSIKIYDIDPRKSTHSLREVVDSHFIFICTPTPMKALDSGEADTSILEKVLSEISKFNPDGTCVIKSTVPAGTTRRLQDEHPSLNLLHSPEFLTARNARVDFITPARHIIGYVRDEGAAYPLRDLYLDRFPGVPCFLMKSEEAEMVKYMSNCFFATKVSFFNEMRLLADRLNLEWDTLLKGVLSDGRIGISHFQVPGHDGEWGFGGSCFPKDINALINVMKDNDIEPHVLQGAWKQNLEVRRHKDWEDNPSAVSQAQLDKRKHLIEEGWVKTDEGYCHPEHGMDLSGCGHDHI